LICFSARGPNVTENLGVVISVTIPPQSPFPFWYSKYAVSLGQIAIGQRITQIRTKAKKLM
jgi:hypothetical protein